MVLELNVNDLGIDQQQYFCKHLYSHVGEKYYLYKFEDLNKIFLYKAFTNKSKCYEYMDFDGNFFCKSALKQKVGFLNRIKYSNRIRTIIQEKLQDLNLFISFEQLKILFDRKHKKYLVFYQNFHPDIYQSYDHLVFDENLKFISYNYDYIRRFIEKIQVVLNIHYSNFKITTDITDRERKIQMFTIQFKKGVVVITTPNRNKFVFDQQGKMISLFLGRINVRGGYFAYLNSLIEQANQEQIIVE